MESSSPIRSTTSPPDYLFDEFIFAELDNSLWIISRPLGSEPILEEPEELETCKLIAGIAASPWKHKLLQWQNSDNPIRYTEPREFPVANKGKETTKKGL
ncbi:hypothetical protein Tco_1549320 [Tanacetum coccineum]